MPKVHQHKAILSFQMTHSSVPVELVRPPPRQRKGGMPAATHVQRMPPPRRSPRPRAQEQFRRTEGHGGRRYRAARPSLPAAVRLPPFRQFRRLTAMRISPPSPPPPPSSPLSKCRNGAQPTHAWNVRDVSSHLQSSSPSRGETSAARRHECRDVRHTPRQTRRSCNSSAERRR